MRLPSPDTPTSAVVVNAAPGNLAGLIATRCAGAGLGFIGIVRKESQAESLRSEGMEFVLVQGQEDFAEALRSVSERLGARVLIDLLGGGASVSTMEALPLDSTALVIGHLSRKPLRMNALPLLLGRRLTLQAFGIAEWMQRQSFLSTLRAAQLSQSLVATSKRGLP